MTDAVYLLALSAFFGACLLYVRVCDRQEEPER